MIENSDGLESLQIKRDLQNMTSFNRVGFDVQGGPETFLCVRHSCVKDDEVPCHRWPLYKNL